MSSNLDAALLYAQSGIPIFPTVVNGKEPATANGFKDATTNEAQIRAWWGDNPGYGIAMCPEDMGWCVVDQDPGGQKPNIPDTYTNQTPRGGFHYIFAGSLPPTTSKIGEHIDTRGRLSYILLPPSVVNGVAYKTVDDREPVIVPDWIVEATKPREKALASITEEQDLPHNVSRAIEYLDGLVKAGDVSIEGHNGNKKMYMTAAWLSDLGLSEEKAVELIEEHYNPHSIPPWSHDELEAEDGPILNAFRYKQNSGGSHATEAQQTLFQEAASLLPTEAPSVAKRSRFYFEDEDEQDNAPDPLWLLPDVFPDQSTVLVLGRTGSFKTYVLEDSMLAIASGEDSCFGVKPVRVGPTFYGAHEARAAIKKSRRQAWRGLHEITHKVPFFVSSAPHIGDEEQCEEFREQIRIRLRQGKSRISGIVLDTVAKCMVGLDENSAADMGRFVAFCDSLRDEFQCCVFAVHHLGKDEDKLGRGSTALQAGFDTTIRVTRFKRTRLVKVEVLQHNSHDEREEPFYLEGMKFGKDLVFKPIQKEDYLARTHGDTPSEQFDGQRVIVPVLREMKAFGEDHAVTTYALAQILCPAVPGTSDADHAFAVGKARRTLNQLAKKELHEYALIEGREVKWCLPPSDAQRQNPSVTHEPGEQDDPED
jgi:hypothetical protein